MNNTSKLTFINATPRKNNKADTSADLSQFSKQLLKQIQPIKITKHYSYKFNLPKIILSSNKQPINPN
ncbi:hypothetical protein [Thalassomonas sp. M1454]|uniref:hypothetical protein n=1 Tax=Thalassomonas sp. M1454 TaxID=2594477 RepID=UPI00117F1709|nr:hypothetical protein [Thalassomonas sp. M1454]TRX57154.1 hypothetical protein FNN08_06555 [Thalassomonas sp. M1454]